MTNEQTKTYYAFNTMFGIVGKFDHIPGTLELNRYVAIGPVHNNNPAPRAFITDDFEEFLHELKLNRFGTEWIKQHVPSAPNGWYDGIDEQTGELIMRIHRA